MSRPYASLSRDRRNYLALQQARQADVRQFAFGFQKNIQTNVEVMRFVVIVTSVQQTVESES